MDGKYCSGTDSQPKFAAIIAAGGVGKRFGGDVPKQFEELCGYPVIAHTVSRFEQCHEISEIVIAAHRDYVVYCQDLARVLEFKKVTVVTEGAQTRQGSVFKALKQLSADVTHVLIHDAARPAVSRDTISACCENAVKYGACAAGVRVADTLKYSEDGEFITSTVDRSKLWSIQTPQGFEKSLILKCHKNAAFEGFDATDDCMLAEKYGHRVKLVRGTADNIKITAPEDLAIMEGIFKCE